MSEEIQKEDGTIYSPLVITRELIAEEVYSAESEEAAYLVRNFDSSRIDKVSEIPTEVSGDIMAEPKGVVYRPLVNETLKKRLVLLPDGFTPCTFAETFGDGYKLTLDIYDSEPDKLDEIGFLVGVAQSSWFLDRFNPDQKLRIPGMGRFAPIIPLRGMPGSGKDRLMNALRLNSYRPFYDVATVRAPSLYRPLDQWKGTLCMSEADFRYSTESAEVIKYLNCRSYGVPYSRQLPESPANNEVFDSFGLTIVTQRRVWEDNATEDRSLPFYCEKTSKPIATQELDDWVRRGVELQNKLLYLRLMFWDKVQIDKAYRMDGIRDHRLTASVLPLVAVSKFEPAFASNLSAVLRIMERKRREVKAMSRDGVLINLLYEKVEDGLIGVHNGVLYVGKERLEKDGDECVIPLITSDAADRLKWSSREVRSVLQSLQLETVPTQTKIKVGTVSYRPIWFDSGRLVARFADYVPDFKANELAEKLGELHATATLDSLRAEAPRRTVPSVQYVPEITPMPGAETDGTRGALLTEGGGS